MLDSGEWLTDHSPDRQPQQKSFEIMKPRLSRVQLPTYVHRIIILLLCKERHCLYRHFSTDDVERSENDFERAQW
jgi:transposase